MIKSPDERSGDIKQETSTLNCEDSINKVMSASCITSIVLPVADLKSNFDDGTSVNSKLNLCANSRRKMLQMLLLSGKTDAQPLLMSPWKSVTSSLGVGEGIYDTTDNIDPLPSARLSFHFAATLGFKDTQNQFLKFLSLFLKPTFANFIVVLRGWMFSS